MIEEGARLFGSLTVAIGTNPDKRGTFSLKERLQLLRDSVAERGVTNVTVDSFHNQYLVRYAEANGALYILRGIRSSADFDYERVMRQMNADLAPEITTVFLMPPRAIAEVSSSLVKGLVGPTGWEETVRNLVPTCVWEALHKRFGPSEK